MSNQVYKNQTARYDLVNSGSVFYVLETNQSIPDATITKVTNYTLDRDDNIGPDISLATGVFTFKRAGVYCIQASALWDQNTVGTRESSILFTPNGGAGRRIAFVQVPSKATGIDAVAQNSVAIVNVGVNDTAQWDVEQDSTGALNLVGSGSDIRSKMVITRIA